MRLIGLLFLVFGCRPAGSFDRNLAERYCERLAACDPLAAAIIVPGPPYRGGCGGGTPCEEWLTSRQAGQCFAEHCRLDHDQAKICLDAVENASCPDFLSGSATDVCRTVWVACDGGQEDCEE